MGHQFFQGLIENASNGFFISNQGGRCLYANKSLSEMLGYDTPEEMLESVTDIFTQVFSDLQGKINFLRQTQGQNQPVSHECLVQRRDGTQLWVLLNMRIIQNQSGESIKYQGEVTDITNLKQNENTFSAFNRDFLIFLENTTDFLYFKDSDRRIRFCSHAMARITGQNDWRELVGKNDFEIFPEETARIYHDEEDQVFQKGIPVLNKLNPYFDENGKSGWVLTNKWPVYDENNTNVVGLFGISRDVTELKKAEESLSHSRDLLRYIVEHTRSAVAVHDRDLNYIFVSQRYLDEFNVKEEDVIGKHHYEVFPDLPQKWRDVHQKALRGQVLSAEDDPYYREDGKMEWTRWECRPWYEKDGAIGGIIVYTEVITERKQAEEILRKSERQLANALNMARMGQWELDLSTGIFLFSDNFYEVFRTNVREMGGYSMTLEEYASRFVHPGDRPLLEEESRKAMETDDPEFSRYIEHRVLYADGTPGYIGVRYLIEKDEHGRTIRTYGVNQDITKRKQDEKALLIAKEQAEAANQAKSEFLANMSHEIRTPLNGIVGMLQLLQMTDMDMEQKEYVNMSINAANRLTRLLSDILDLSRVEAGKMSVKEEEFCLKEVEDSVMGLFKITARDKNVILESSMDQSLPEKVTGDPYRVRQILFNLVGNALKYTEHGKVQLRIAPLSSEAGNICKIIFIVSDTGIGISKDKLRFLFNPFFQVEGSYTRTYQGAGLGLAIVKRLVDLMGGEISVSSTVGEGTSVQVVLPFKLKGVEKVPGKQEHGAMAETDQSLRILLAEDDPDNQFSIRRILERLGHLVIVAENGQKVLDLLATQDFDLILMDIQMPVIDGVEAARIIRSQDAGQKKDIPIIALTAYAMAGDQEKFLEAGMNAYLGKPVTIEELKSVLRDISRQ